MKEFGEINNDWRFIKYIPKPKIRSLIHVGVNVKLYYDEVDNIYYICINNDKYYLITTTNIDDVEDIKAIVYYINSEILIIQSKDNRYFIFDKDLKPIRLKVISNEE